MHTASTSDKLLSRRVGVIRVLNAFPGASITGEGQHTSFSVCALAAIKTLPERYDDGGYPSQPADAEAIGLSYLLLLLLNLVRDRVSSVCWSRSDSALSVSS